MNIENLSGQPEGVLRSWLPHSLKAEHVIFLPDACPGKSPLPTGTAVRTRQEDWRRYAISDCGCGMRLMRSTLRVDDLTQAVWDAISLKIQSNKGQLGDLGGGNHFLDALLPYDEEYLYFLVHTGSRNESGMVDSLVDSPLLFDTEFDRIVAWAESNRAEIHRSVESVTGRLELIIDLPHNTYEKCDEGAIIRKGSVKMLPGEMSIIPSHMSGDAILVRATERIGEVLYSMSHGTGRKMSRSQAKEAAAGYDFEELRNKIMLPSFLKDSSLTTEAPFAYRDLDDCLALIDGFVEEVRRFSVIAYAGHL